MAEKKRIPPDREIVERFIEHLRDDGHPDLKIDSWPEDDHPGQSVVEAIAGNLAIEHTSVDTLPDERRIGEQFMDALGVLDHLPATARLSISVPYELVTIGSDWEAYRLALAHWKYEFQIMGVVDDGFTSAEISEEGSDSLVRVFELERSWYVECDQLERLREPELLDAVLRARDELLH